MKLKFTNVLLAAAIAFGAAVGFSSCKDTQDDMFMGVESEYAALKKKVDELQARLDAIKIPEIKDWALKSELTAAVEDLQGKIDEINTALEKLGETYVDWETYNTKMQEIDEAIKKLDERVTDLEKEVKDIKQYLENIDKRISSIQLHQTITPAFGGLNTPLNVKSLALFNFYGEIGPNTMGLPEGPVYAGTKAGALGTLYYSLNPTDLDPSNYTIELVKSNGVALDEKVVALSDSYAPADDELLTMGLSRADNNIVWKIDAGLVNPTTDVTSAEAIKIDLQITKDEVKDILKSHNIASIAEIPELVKKVLLNNTSMHAYALKATWEEVDTTDVNKTITKSAISDFAIMVNAFQPFSYETLNDAHGPQLPLLPDLDGLKEKYDAYVDEVKGEVEINFNNFKITLNTNEVYIDVTTDNGEQVTVKGENLQKLMDEINNAIKDDLAADINVQIQDIIDTLTIKAWNRTSGKLGDIYNLLTKVYNKIADAIYTPNLVLQPVCFVRSAENGELYRLSEVSTIPSEIVAGEATILATSWTGELLAPSYMKEFNGVQKPGTENEFDVTIEKGDNVFVYKTIDFHGVEVTKTYHVQGI